MPFRHDALCRNTSMSPRAASVYGVAKMAWMAMYMKQCSQQYERPIKKSALYTRLTSYHPHSSSQTALLRDKCLDSATPSHTAEVLATLSFVIGHARKLSEIHAHESSWVLSNFGKQVPNSWHHRSRPLAQRPEYVLVTHHPSTIPVHAHSLMKLRDHVRSMV